MQIGYLIPEFPGQTHIFFWREKQVLAELKIHTDLVSTRRPQKGIISHSWSQEAQQKTFYLLPFTIQDAFASLIYLFRARLLAFLHCLTIVIKGKDTSLIEKIRLLAMIFVASKLILQAKKKGWHHIHVHSCADAANVAMFASILSDMTYSLTLHGPTLDLYGANQSQKWQHASFAFVVSEKLLNTVKSKLEKFLPQKIAVVPMGVNLTEIKRHKSYIPWQPGIQCKIFSCGRLNPIKGHKYLINSVELLRQRGFDVELAIAGEDEEGGHGYRQELEKIIYDKSLSLYVHLLGAVSEDKIRSCLEDAHIFALASLNEGISVAVMEAMAMETPVVVTDVGGMKELIDDGIDGIIVQPEKAEEMADAIEKVIQNKQLALYLSQKSRQKIANNFHHRRSAEILASCLELVKDK